MSEDVQTDIVVTSLSELVLFLLFFFLILLGAEPALNGAQNPAPPSQANSQAPSIAPTPSAIPAPALDQNLIVVDGTTSFAFVSGSVTIPPGLATHLDTVVVPNLVSMLNQGNLVRPVIEVIGHTDETFVHPRIRLTNGGSIIRCTNLDWQLPMAYFNASPPPSNILGRCSGSELQYVDNAGLALARAAAVTNRLRSNSALSGFNFVVYSGGQLNSDANSIDLDNIHWTASDERRRIEIRVREAFALPAKP